MNVNTIWWYQEGRLAKLPLDVIGLVLEFVHPIYPEIHRRLERLNRELPNHDKYYLAGRLLLHFIPTGDVYDPNIEYNVCLNMRNFIVLGALVSIAEMLLIPITSRNKREPRTTMSIKHIMEDTLGRSLYVRGDTYGFNWPGIGLPNSFDTHVSREMAVIALIVRGWDYTTNGKIRIPRSSDPKQDDRNESYFEFNVRRRVLTKKQMANHPNIVKRPRNW